MPTIINQDSAGNTYWGYIDSILGNQGLTIDALAGTGILSNSNVIDFLTTAYGLNTNKWNGSSDNGLTKCAYGLRFPVSEETKTGAISGSFSALTGTQQSRCAINFYNGNFGFSSSNEESVLGASWGGNVLIASPAGIHGITLLSNGDLLAVGFSSNMVHRSTDHRVPWGAGALVESGAGLIGITQLINGNIVAVGYTSNRIYTSTDGGSTWDAGVLIASGAGIFDVIQLANGDLLSVGFSSSRVYRSTNNGATWDSGVLISGAGLIGITQTSNGNVFVSGFSTASVYKSTNNGTTWDSGAVVTGATGIYKLFSINNTIYCCADTSQSIHSSIDGVSWSLLANVTTGLRDICLNAIGDLCLVSTGNDNIYFSNTRFWINSLSSFSYASAPSPSFRYMIANDYSLTFVNVGGGSNGRNSQGFVLYMGWLKNPGYTGNQYPRNFAYMLNSANTLRATLVNATGTTNFSTAANSITNPTIACEVATSGADATDIIFRDDTSPNNAIGKPYNMISLPSSFAVGNIYTNNGVDPDGGDNNKWLCVGNWGSRKLGVRVWTEGYI